MNARPPIAFDDLLPDLPAALCAQVGDPELWHPTPGQKASDAKSICGRCPEMDACLTYALAHDVEGIWGGTTERQRQDWRRDNGRRSVPLSTNKYLPIKAKAPETARPLEPIKHGDRNGARAHRKRGEDPCEPCVLADRAYRRERRNRAA